MAEPSTWIAITVAASGAAATLTYTITKAFLDNTAARLAKIEITLQSVDDKIDSKMKEFGVEFWGRVEKANKEHAEYDKRLDRLEIKAGLRGGNI